MAEVHTHVDIEAPAERVWQILTDFSGYAEWNPFICRASGDAREGAELTLTLQPPGAEPRSKSALVTMVKPNQELRWIDRAGPPGVLTCERVFKIERRGPQQSRVVQWKAFQGLLGPLWSARSEGATRDGFEAMNRALKERAECQAGADGHEHDGQRSTSGHDAGVRTPAARVA